MKSKVLWGGLVIVALIVGGGGGYLLGTGKLKSDHLETTVTELNSPSIEFPNLELTNLNVDNMTGSLQGVIKNKTNHSVAIDHIELDYFDSSNKLLGTGVEGGEPTLKPNGSETFMIVSYVDSVNTATKLEVKIKYK